MYQGVSTGMCTISRTSIMNITIRIIHMHMCTFRRRSILSSERSTLCHTPSTLHRHHHRSSHQQLLELLVSASASTSKSMRNPPLHLRHRLYIMTIQRCTSRRSASRRRATSPCTIGTENLMQISTSMVKLHRCPLIQLSRFSHNLIKLKLKSKNTSLSKMRTIRTLPGPCSAPAK